MEKQVIISLTDYLEYERVCSDIKNTVDSILEKYAKEFLNYSMDSILNNQSSFYKSRLSYDMTEQQLNELYESFKKHLTMTYR